VRQDIQPYLKAGLEIGSICEECPFLRDPCAYRSDYEKAYRDRPNLAITHAHINTFLPRFLNTDVGDHKIRDEYDVIIIDENPIKVFSLEKRLSLGDLEQLRQIYMMTGMDQVLIDLVNELLKGELDYTALMRLPLRTLKEIELNKKFIKRLMEHSEDLGTMLPKDIISFMFRIYERATADNLPFMVYKHEGYINLAYFNEYPLNLGVKIIGLDGTASKLVWDQMLHDELIEGDTLYRIDNSYTFDPDNGCYAISYQLSGARYPIFSFKQKGDLLPKKLSAQFDIIAKQTTANVLIVATKEVYRRINKYMVTKNHEFANYYNLRSFNRYYKTCDTVILACEPNPPKEKIQSSVALSGWSNAVWRLIYTEEEMLQAVGRLRANVPITTQGRIRSLPLHVYIFPSTGVKAFCSCGMIYEKETKRCVCGQNLMLKPTLLKEARLIKLGKIDETDKYGRDYLDDDECLRRDILKSCPTSPSKYSGGSISRTRIRSRFKYLLEEGLIEYEKLGTYKLTQRGFEQLSQSEKENRHDSD